MVLLKLREVFASPLKLLQVGIIQCVTEMEVLLFKSNFMNQRKVPTE